MPWVTFHNVTVSINAGTPKAAYTMLCDLLASDPDIETDWTSDTYSLEDGKDPRSTMELFPLEKE